MENLAGYDFKGDIGEFQFGFVLEEGYEGVFYRQRCGPTSCPVPNQKAPSTLQNHKKCKQKLLNIKRMSKQKAKCVLIELTDIPKEAYAKVVKAHGSSGSVLDAVTMCGIVTASLNAGQCLSDCITHLRNLHNQLAQYATGIQRDRSVL
ncbi:uncharacterized protein MELLADRAFT_111182 [Melampsora larici-populina 98AG31]|uniref:Uncharacterized protein n=1 Tax=Melampsora larici-populina (strain 98AG31 / pathotype 3-4-7) TaxID=747676 RepID=F4S2A6_MELLP|nr:uncharacterized protein MELLADRAFT_111182 [Melampsora larici-populina 98AG31]EGG01141.1 hypothetical protein MELLADRAFT_111182 [Melampsora larici-populina 98AG31]